VDGDGLDDLIIGARGADPNGSDSGETYFISGADLAALDATSGTDGVIELSDVAGTGGSYQFNGVDASDQAGLSVASAGDADGDGLDDLIIGARRADPNGLNSGETYFISGADLAALDAASGTDGVIELSDVAGMGGSYQFNGIDSGDNAGISVASAGDVDGDGLDDLIIGAWLAEPNGTSSGETYFISGGDLAALDAASGTDGVIELSDVAGTAGSYQFNGIDAGDTAGSFVSSAGDADGDGLDDLIIGARGAEPNGITSGETYFISGADLAALDAASGTDGVIELSDVAGFANPTGLTVDVDGTGTGTVLKPSGETDTVTSVENFIANEVSGQTDEITITDTGTGFTTADIADIDTGAEDGQTAGTFTPTATGVPIAFGPTDDYSYDDIIGAIEGTPLVGGPNDGEVLGNGNFQITSGDETGSVGGIGFENFETINFAVVCFTRGTRIKTIAGERRIEDLKEGDLVFTVDHGYQPIRWIGSRALNQETLEAHERLKPIRIRVGALGPNMPDQDLLVSPQHRVLVRSVIAMKMFGVQEALIPANKLLVLPGIDIERDAESVEYWHMLFEQHEVIWSNGALTESLFTGPEALKAVSPEAVEEIRTLFPQICEPDFVPQSARYIPEKGKLMKKLAQRHAQNNKALVKID
jgi:hypothetical protein